MDWYDKFPHVEDPASQDVQVGKWSTQNRANDHTTRHYLVSGMAQIVKETQDGRNRKLEARKHQIVRRSPKKRILRYLTRRKSRPRGDLRSFEPSTKNSWSLCFWPCSPVFLSFLFIKCIFLSDSFYGDGAQNRKCSCLFGPFF